ncbi:DUF4231 domain-containing protein [Streptoalloteichus hindustanus]|uniref:SMODS and SLOG-associating 2TM effector domain-containing protein n=1 Tax=Streptoalloteichus hindustanus TaxID=2017 RepID=A0A1M5MY15_STRHI|nr:DUF4231 domain-containing protein [Streptoalloteichus hindustanus]SHG82107.1 Protein of unknown function [Streptoalloteichus hindustanus]
MASSEPGDAVAYRDYPGVYQAADQASLRGQRAYLRAVRARLVLAVLAAATAAVTVRVGSAGIDVCAVATALCFVSALAVDVLVLRGQPNRTWHRGRALAEATKTLAWRYMVGATPFPTSLPDQDSTQLLLERLAAQRADLASVQLLPSRSAPISPRMRELRAAPLEVRKRTYLTNRIEEQRDWYAGRAEFHQRWANRYRVLALLLEVLGVAAALAKACDLVSFDLAGIVAALISAVAAWMATRQHNTLVNAYVLASHELGLIHERLSRELDEETWASAVADAEAAISREHSTWRSSHGR